MGRKVNDGDLTGLKQDKMRHSRFELEEEKRMNRNRFGGVTRKTPNTLGGPFAENRGRRAADSDRSLWDGSPFEDREIYNWNNHDSSWKEFYQRIGNDRGNRKYGDARLDHEGSHFGKGPKGYKRSDELLYEDVCNALEISPLVDASNIEVSVRNGVVCFSGTVEDREAKRFAEFEVENISGVKDVQNLLKISKKDRTLN